MRKLTVIPCAASQSAQGSGAARVSSVAGRTALAPQARQGTDLPGGGVEGRAGDLDGAVPGGQAEGPLVPADEVGQAGVGHLTPLGGPVEPEV